MKRVNYLQQIIADWTDLFIILGGHPVPFVLNTLPAGSVTKLGEVKLCSLSLEQKM